MGLFQKRSIPHQQSKFLLSKDRVEENHLKNVLELHRRSRQQERDYFFISSKDKVWILSENNPFYHLGKFGYPKNRIKDDVKSSLHTFFAHNNIPITRIVCWNLIE